MTLKEAIEYAQFLGCTVAQSQFDGGQSVAVSYGSGAVMVTWRGSYEWGDDAQFARRLARWLNGLPWPTEDDPRVEHEGVYA